MSEAEVRQLRAAVFTKDCSDDGWAAVRANWMRPEAIEWLREKGKRPLKNF